MKKYYVDKYVIKIKLKGGRKNGLQNIYRFNECNGKF